MSFDLPAKAQAATSSTDTLLPSYVDRPADCLWRLPLELREHIYGHLFPEECLFSDISTRLKGDGTFDPAICPYFHVENHQFRDEVTRVFHSSRTMEFSLEYRTNSWLRAIGSAGRNQFWNLRVVDLHGGRLLHDRPFSAPWCDVRMHQ